MCKGIRTFRRLRREESLQGWLVEQTSHYTIWKHLGLSRSANVDGQVKREVRKMLRSAQALARSAGTPANAWTDAKYNVGS